MENWMNFPKKKPQTGVSYKILPILDLKKFIREELVNLKNKKNPPLLDFEESGPVSLDELLL